MIKECLALDENIRFSDKIESVVLQNALQWIYLENLDARWYATNILFSLLKNPENAGIINHKLVELIDRDNVYIKNLIIRNIYTTDGVANDVCKYIVDKCSNDPNYVVRMVCEKERIKHEAEEKADEKEN